MFNFLNTYGPEPILISLGPINIYWYGVFIVTGILAGIAVALKLAERYRLDKNIIIDAVFYLIIGGIVGARLYHVILELPFYLANPFSVIKIYEGGLAIHGAIIAGVIVLCIYTRRLRNTAANERFKNTAGGFWFLSSLFVAGLALAQAIGRFGNYFNQELFGRPTDLPWGIPIRLANRPLEYFGASHFHPAFLYEALGNFLIFAALLALHYFYLKNKKSPDEIFLLCYLGLYSVLRFLMEFIRVDPAAVVLGLRWPQITSLAIIASSLGYYIWKRNRISRLSNQA